MSEQISRRAAIQASGMVALGLATPNWLTSLAQADALPIKKFSKKTLVICHLSGGNDGLNTLIPYTDQNYYRLRPTLAVPERQVLKIDHRLGFNPALTGLNDLYQQGKVAAIQNVGYPNPSRSHFKSLNIWQSASPDGDFQTGWIDRHVDREFGDRLSGPFVAFNDEENQQNTFEVGFRKAAYVIASSPSTRVVSFSAGGFDTHARQAEHHQQLLKQFGDAVKAFQTGVESIGRADDVVVLVFSEFGRSAHENASSGTDHGEAGPVFLIGNRVKGAIYGSPPDLRSGGIPHEIDFREVYTALIDRWMGGNSEAVLGQRFTPVDVLSV